MIPIKHRTTGAVLREVDADTLRRANLGGADLTGANLRRANLGGADLRRANLRRADLSGADLTGAYLEGANLRRANLDGAYLTGAYLTGADLRGAYLTGANLRGAYLTGAYLTGAYLTGANLRGADLRGAYLTGADLTGAKLPWSSHDLLAECLRRAAGENIPRLSLAGLVLLQREWCWNKFTALRHPHRKWALTVLAEYIQPDDQHPKLLDRYRTREATP